MDDKPSWATKSSLPPSEEDVTPGVVPKTGPPPSSSAASALGGTDKRPVETWAEAKGLFPMELRLQGVNGPSTVNSEFWKFAATKAMKSWADGQLVTEAEFDAALAEQLGASHR